MYLNYLAMAQLQLQAKDYKMFRTTKHIEENMEKMAKILNLQDEPKWMTIRFAINTSLSLQTSSPIDLEKQIDYEGGFTYKAEVITGRNKTDVKGIQGDYTDLMAVMVSNAHDCKLDDINSLEKYLEKHLVRGFKYLESSLNEKSSVFIWLKNEFKL